LKITSVSDILWPGMLLPAAAPILTLQHARSRVIQLKTQNRLAARKINCCYALSLTEKEKEERERERERARECVRKRERKREGEREGERER
jgi:hypothetical protein